MSWKYLAAAALAVAACKADAPSSSSVSPSSDEPATSSQPGAPRPRSGKVELPSRTPSLDPGTPPTTADPRTSDDIAERRRERMARVDTDGDGSISEQERAAARHERAVTMHDRLDADHDGKLTQAELAASPMLRRFGDEPVDTNHDGQISVDELEAALKLRAGRWGRPGRGDAADDGAGSAPAP
ncbi:MAG TPA: hypothetical protein VFQ53_08205 [Kofleriaceae bacterium]|nr:hypothetical protein [Kofleriaceae bacterium]